MAKEDALAAVIEWWREARERAAQAELEHEHASGHEKAETYAPVGYWANEVAAARAAWRALAGPDAIEP
jgi:hypothetical protein